jgi:CTP:molybdopterin cytidylyltransferase MocA
VTLRGARIGVAVLAAGASRRLGHPKQALSYKGRPLLRRALDAACGSSATFVSVVVGAEQALVAELLEDTDVDVVENGQWQEGMSSSVRAAVAWARRRDCDGLLLAVADQPHLSSAHLNALVAASQGATRIAASAYADVLGVPALFPWELFHRLEGLSGDAGARSLLRHTAFRVIAVPWPAGARDVDTAADAAGLDQTNAAGDHH